MHEIKLFFKEGIKKFKIHGSLLPSSKYLAERILKHVKMKDDVFIIELGAGTGTFTEMIISKLPENGRLIVFEINPIMVDHLRKHFIDHRVTIIHDDATNITRHISADKTDPDYIISGIPIGNFSKKMRDDLLCAIDDVMSDDSLFIQFQYLLASFVPINRFFNTKIIGYEYRNIPPAFIYGCRKK